MKSKDTIKELILPLLLGITVCLGFFVFIAVSDDVFPFDDTVQMGYHSLQKVYPKADQDDVSTLISSKSNTLVAQLNYNNTRLDIVYDCSDVNLAGEMCSLESGSTPLGEIGCAYIYGYKANMAEVLNVQVGDSVTVTSPYDESVLLTYKCVGKDTATAKWQVLNNDYNSSYGLVIYSESTASVGIGADYDVAVFELEK